MAFNCNFVIVLLISLNLVHGIYLAKNETRKVQRHATNSDWTEPQDEDTLWASLIEEYALR